jgi:hypothetical protein
MHYLYKMQPIGQFRFQCFEEACEYPPRARERLRLLETRARSRVPLPWIVRMSDLVAHTRYE